MVSRAYLRGKAGFPVRNRAIGKNLKHVENPDEITVIPIDKRTLPKGKYHDAGYDARQVIDIRISRFVTENDQCMNVV